MLPPRFLFLAVLVIAFFQHSHASASTRGYVRVSQIGYETGTTPFRAYLMAAVAETGATFKVLDAKGATVYSADIGPLLGTWSHNKILTYNVYAVDFSVPGKGTYSITVAGPAPASSPSFAVDCAAALYSGLLLNTRFFYESERDGPQ